MIGMIHVRALPGTPHNRESIRAVADRAAEEARALAQAGFDALMIENMHDRPYLLRSVGPEIVAAMTAVGMAVAGASSLPLGVQILAGANREALAVAAACGASFIRAEGFVFAHVADEGLMATADAGDLLRYRRAIGADHIAVYADVKKKHASHAVTSDVDLAETARAAAFFDADGIIVTGTATGSPALPADVRVAAEAFAGPVLVGSGIGPENLADYWPHAGGFIVGSYLKRDGLWSNELDSGRIAALRKTVDSLRAAD